MKAPPRYRRIFTAAVKKITFFKAIPQVNRIIGLFKKFRFEQCPLENSKIGTILREEKRCAAGIYAVFFCFFF
jgi:hypothetical protein